MMQIDYGESTFWIAYVISNVGAATMAITAWKMPRVSRAIFVGLFSWACFFNLRTVESNPAAYLDYGLFAVLPIYQQFINGWFAENIRLVVSSVAYAQGVIAIGMLFGGVSQRIASFIALCFFIGILPLGLGSAFPAPILMAMAAYRHLQYPGAQLWKSSRAVK